MEIQTLYAELLERLSGLEAGRAKGIAGPIGFLSLGGPREMEPTDGFEPPTR